MQQQMKYMFKVKALAVSSSTTATVDLDKNVKDFTCTALSAMVMVGTLGTTKANEVQGLCLINIKPASDDGGIFNEAMPLPLVTGTGAEPHILDNPVIFPGNSSPVLEITNLTSDTVYDVYVVMHGYRTKK
jgi:hypothetical protein